MKRIVWAMPIAVGTWIAGAVFAGCGSDESNDNPTADSGPETSSSSSSSSSSSGSVPNDSGAILHIDASTCKQVGQSCATAFDCCTGACGADGGTGAGTCAPGNGSCRQPGEGCLAGPDCCTGTCINNQCGSSLCLPDKPTPAACTQNGECCSGICQNGACASVNPTNPCRTDNNPCAGNGDCCSGFCDHGYCSSSVSFCVQQNEICSANFQCCTGNCVKAAGQTTGYCGDVIGTGAGGCKPAGTVCGSGGTTACDQSCCSRSCGPYGGANDFKVCQPPSGCRPTGEICQTNADCCGSAESGTIGGIPVDGPVTCNKVGGSQYGRCSNNPSCNEPGALCKSAVAACSVSNNCCEPPDMPQGTNCNNSPELCCRLDALLIPRCAVSGVLSCDAGAPAAGTKCATSADCCGNPCINYQCQGVCIQQGGSCTTGADCCPGLPCVMEPGSTKGICGGTLLADGGISDAAPPPPDSGTSDAAPGDAGTCALYGQVCSGAGQCCNSVPCTSGRCVYP